MIAWPRKFPSEFWLKTALVSLLSSRVLLLAFAPICDPTEARYAEIARKMAETGNWITPQFDYGVPFWGKPPLSIWLSALGIRLFGANEFGARIFIFLSSVLVLVLVFAATRREYGRRAGLVAAAILLATPLFFYSAATVMTDLVLVLGTTLAMLGFRQCLLERSRIWGYAIFIGLAIGLLAKGPLALVIALPPIVGWIALTRRAREAWLRVPWLSGLLLMFALAVPWYVLAEKKTAGFLQYFLVGEHWKRFFESGWKGDLYGQGHAAAVGTIWLFALATSFPWCLGFLGAPLRPWRRFRAWSLAEEGRGLYWTLWALWPLVFFTPTRNIIASYPLPAFPAIAILLAEISWRRTPVVSARGLHSLHPFIIALAVLITGSMLVVGLLIPQTAPKLSERELVRYFLRASQPGDRLAYYQGRKLSAEFYSRGAAIHLDSPSQLEKEIGAAGHLFLASTPQNFSKLPLNIRKQLEPAVFFSGRMALYRQRQPNE